MKPFIAPLDDIQFSLNHVAGANDLADWNPDFAAEIGSHFAAFSEGDIAPLDKTGRSTWLRVERWARIKSVEPHHPDQVRIERLCEFVMK